FVIHCSTLRHELRKHRGTSKAFYSSAALRFEVPDRACGRWRRNFKSAALASGREAQQPTDNGRGIALGLRVDPEHDLARARARPIRAARRERLADPREVEKRTLQQLLPANRVFVALARLIDALDHELAAALHLNHG